MEDLTLVTLARSRAERAFLFFLLRAQAGRCFASFRFLLAALMADQRARVENAFLPHLGFFFPAVASRDVWSFVSGERWTRENGPPKASERFDSE